MSREPESNGPPRDPSGNALAERMGDPQMIELYYGANRDAEREFTLRDYWCIMRSHAGLIISITATITLLVAFWLALGANYYEGHARIEIDLISPTPPPAQTENRLPPVEMDPEYFATQMQIIRSPMVLEQVIKALDLEHDDIYKKYMAKGGRKIRQLLQLSFLAKKDPLITRGPEGSLLTNALDPAVSPEDLKKSKDLEAFVRDLQQRLTTEPVKEPSTVVKDTRLISIVVRHPSPALASKLANAIADATVLSNKEGKLQAGRTTNAYLARRIKDLQSEVREDEGSLAEYAAKHNILSLDPSQNTEIERLEALNRQLVEAENARKEAEANYREALEPITVGGFIDLRADQISATQLSSADAPAKTPSAGGNLDGKSSSVSGAVAGANFDLGPASTAADALAEQDQKQIADLEARLPELRQKRAQLLVGATEQWPEVKEVDDQIVSLEHSLEQMRSHASSVLIANLETKYRQELAHETSIRNALESQRRVTQVQNQDAVGYRLLQQQIETKKNLLNEYLKQFNGNDIAQAAMSSNIRVIDYATLPAREDIAGPWRLLWVILAFLITLPLSMALAFFLESWDNTLRSSDEVQQVMQVPVLAVIPSGVKKHYLLRTAQRAKVWFSRAPNPSKDRPPRPLS